MEVWDIAQKCWSQVPADRPSFQTVLDKLDAFAGMEAVAPFSLREPRPMQVQGVQPSYLVLTAPLRLTFVRPAKRNYNGMAGTVNRNVR